MLPVRTLNTVGVYGAPTGLEDEVGGLPYHRETYELGGREIVEVVSVWTLNSEERAEVAAGADIELGITGEPIPPVSLRVASVDAPPAADVEDGSYTDADMLRAAALAGRAYTDRLDAERRADVDGRVMALLILDEQEMAEIQAALASRPQSPVGTPLFDQITEWLADLPDES